ncbi:replication protein A 70 kDa DNA-binding subunit A, partial [Striga asiatica]
DGLMKPVHEQLCSQSTDLEQTIRQASLRRWRAKKQRVGESLLGQSYPSAVDKPNLRFHDEAASYHCVLQKPRVSYEDLKKKKKIHIHANLRENRNMPIIFTLWNEFATIEVAELAKGINARNVFIAMRVTVTTFHGISLSTVQPSSAFINPPATEANQLKQW